jgi:hypothetical protein
MAARAIATPCRWPQEPHPPLDVLDRHREPFEGLLRPRRHRGAVEHAEAPEQPAPPQLPPDVDVRHARAVVREREVLVDRLDSGAAGIERRVEPHVRARHADLAVIRPHDAGGDLQQRRLARAVVAHDGVDLSA